MKPLLEYCRKFIKISIDYIINYDQAWPFLRPLTVLGDYIQKCRQRYINRRELEDAQIFFEHHGLFQSRTVLHGPFEGLKYPSRHMNFGSAIYPKLLGSYERELHELVESICRTPYQTIIDIGCGEGYYAAGLAFRIPGAEIFAYDTNPLAREYCSLLVSTNGLASRVTVREFCSPEVIEKFDFSRGKSLIVCDCEGYEAVLFTESNLMNLKTCDILIETHDLLDISISGKLADLFSKTHDIKWFQSVDDIQKVKTYSFPETEGLEIVMKKLLLSEGRGAIMEWLMATPKVTESRLSGLHC